MSEGEEGEEVQGRFGRVRSRGATNPFAELRCLGGAVTSPEQQRFDFLNGFSEFLGQRLFGAPPGGSLEKIQSSLYFFSAPRCFLKFQILFR